MLVNEAVRERVLRFFRLQDNSNVLEPRKTGAAAGGPDADE